MATTTNKKPAAKKTATTKKAATTKKSATKPVAKKTTTTTATKTATKKVTEKVTTKSVEISVTGNKKVETLKKEFNKKYPYLSIRICYPYAKQVFESQGICYEVQDYKTIADVRRCDSTGDISIAGNKKIKTLEKEFEDKLGLFFKVCYQETKDCSYPVFGKSEEYTLAAYNALCEKRGCLKGYWK